MKNILRNFQLSLFFKNSFYNQIFSEGIDGKIQYNPESLWKGNKFEGSRIIDGFLNFQKESVFINSNVWDKNHGSIAWNCYLHSFMWIKDVRAVGTDEARIFLRKKVLSWIEQSDYLSLHIWDVEVMSKRIFYLLTNLSFFFETANESFQKKFAENINKQSILLLKKIKKVKNLKNKIFLSKSLLLASLCFKNLEKNFEYSIKLLQKTIEITIKDGMHYLRSPSEHFYFLCSILDIKNFFGNLNKELPNGLNETIKEMTLILDFFRLGDGHLAIFNKDDFIGSNKIYNLQKKIGHKYRLPSVSECSGFNRVSKNKLIFIMDCGSPSMEKTQAGSLSFELSYLSEKIVVNCGSPFVNNREWDDAMRSTAAHSTLNINEINSSDIFFDKDTTSRIARVFSEKFNKNENVWINSYHEGYKDIFSIIHKRLIHIDLKNFVIRGEDSFEHIKTNQKHKNLKYFLRFHIHPSIKLNVTTSKKKVVLKLRNNQGWEFICSEPKIEIHDGIYLGENKIVQPNYHILIKDRIFPKTKINWLFRLIT